MGANGKDDLKIPLLQPPDAVVVDIKPVRSVDQGTRTITFKIGGIECASCSISIESVLLKLNGVEIVVVSPLQGQAVVKYMPKLVGVSNCDLSLVFFPFFLLCYITWLYSSNCH